MLVRMDERLRALDRRAADDVQASWARLRGLARSRARRELILEVGRLARAGDPAARDVLERWSPLRPLPLAPEHDVEAWRVTTHALAPGPWLEPAAVLALGEGLAVLHRAVGQGWGRLSVVRLDDASGPAWTSDTGGVVAWRGEDLVHTSPRSGAGGVLVARELVTGEVVGRRALRERVWSLAIRGERGLLRTGDPRGRARLACFDAGEADFGRELWARELPFGVEAHLVGDRVVEIDAGTVRGLDLETGALAWRRELDELEGLSLEHALALPGERWLVLHAAPDDLDRATTLCLDPDDGAVRWAREGGWRRAPSVGPALVVLREAGARLLALDLATGVPAWETTFTAAQARATRRVVVTHAPPALPPGGGQPGAHHVALARARDGRVVSQATLEAPDAATVSVLAADAWAAVAASSLGRLDGVELAPA